MDFRFKALGAKPKEGDVVIEGYANYFAPDAYNERMDPKSVRMERFKKNPILLFNHDMNYPVGKVLEVDPREDGLWVKAAVSGVDHDKVSYVRELVKDGTLSTFSVRFSGETVEHDDMTGGKLIKDWELQELSIVSIPAQPDSTFSLSNVKSLKDLRHEVLKAKGAMAAAYIQDHLEKVAMDLGVERAELVEKIGDASDYEEGQLADALAGNITPLSETFMEACAHVLGCDILKLHDLNAQDVQEEQKAQPPEPQDPKPEEMKATEAEVQACVSEKIPKLIKEGYEQSQAAAIAYDMCRQEKKSTCEKCDGEGGVKELVNDNPTLQIMQSQLEMLGSLNAKMDMLIQVVQSMAGSQPAPQEPKMEPKPSEKPSVEMDMQVQKMIAEYQERIKALLG